MTGTLDLGPLVAAAADYQHAIARLERAAGDAEQAWKLLPAALDSPGTQIAVGRYVGPAHQLSAALLHAANSLHGVLLASVQPLRHLEAEAAPGDAGLAARVGAEEAQCAAAIAAIRGGEAGSVDLPCPAPAPTSSYSVHAASAVIPIAPTSGLPGFGTALVDGAGAAETLGAFGLFGALGLVLSLGGSTGPAATPAPDNRKPRPGVDEVRVTTYTPCSPFLHGPGCQERHLSVEKPGDEPFTGAMVRGDEPPGEMPGTEPDWVQQPTKKGDGSVYRSPDGREMRVMKPGADERYPNGYVAFKNADNQRIDLYWKTHFPKTSDNVHITRNPDGSFPIPEGWTK